MEYHPPWQQVSGNTAEVYERHLVPAMFAPWAAKLIDLAEVGPGRRVLDVACGTGVVTCLAAERIGSAGRVVGLDINATMLSVARRLALVVYQLGATPLSTLGSVTEEAQRAVARDVRAALQPYLHGGQLAVPMAAHVALGRT